MNTSILEFELQAERANRELADAKVTALNKELACSREKAFKDEETCARLTSCINDKASSAHLEALTMQSNYEGGLT